MENDNYIVVQGWMINELQLKGNELIMYAVIHGFSQDENSSFTGSLSYLADTISASKSSVVKCLKSLCNKELIIKSFNVVNNIKFCEYRSKKYNGGIVKSTTGYSKKYNGGIVKSTTNNIYNNKNNNIDINKKFIKPTIEEIKKYVAEKKLNVDTDFFFTYFDEGGWVDSRGNKVKNWKQKLLTWNRQNKAKEEPTPRVSSKDPFEDLKGGSNE